MMQLNTGMRMYTLRPQAGQASDGQDAGVRGRWEGLQMHPSSSCIHQTCARRTYTHTHTHALPQTHRLNNGRRRHGLLQGRVYTEDSKTTTSSVAEISSHGVTPAGPGKGSRTTYPKELDLLLDPSCDTDTFTFPSHSSFLHEKMNKKALNRLIRKLIYVDATWQRAELVVNWLEDIQYPVDSWMYTELLRNLRKRGQAAQAIQLYERVSKSQPTLKLSSHFYAEAMLAASKGTELESHSASKMWDDLLRRNGNALSKYALTAFLCACASNGDWKSAWKAFHTDFFQFQSTMPGTVRYEHIPDVVACTALMKALRAGGQWQKGEQLLEWMYENSISPNMYTYTEVIGLLGECNQWEKALAYFEAIFEGVKDSQGSQLPELNMHIVSVTVAALGQAGKIELAQNVFDKVLDKGMKPNSVVLVSLLGVYERMHLGQKALSLFRNMQRKGLMDPNIFVYNVLLSALSKSEDAENAKLIFDEMCREGRVRPDRITYETLLTAYGNVGDVPNVNKTFESMIKRGFHPTDYAYTARIKAYAKNRCWREAIALLKEAELKGIGTSVHMYNAVLYACEMSGKWELSLKLFDMMQMKGVHPNDTTKELLARLCDSGIEAVEDKQRQAAALSAIAAAAGALAMKTGIL